jgi:protein-tyrosine phosphatase
MNGFRFGPAYQNEPIVFAARGPARSSPRIKEWIAFMKEQGIRRVCCLLHENQLQSFKEDLLAAYNREFGQGNICWAPIEDYHLCDVSLLKERVLPFLKESDGKGEPVVVHCEGGRGRTGQIVTAWLIFARGFSIEEAVSAARAGGRNPHEAADWGNAEREEVYALLAACQGNGVP